MTTEQAAEVAKRNDEFRNNVSNYTLTRGVLSLGSDIQDVCYVVRHYSVFDEGNDPYGEHDFGSFEILGKKFFWKIDYYDSMFTHWCDPLSDECSRVLTVMLSEEY